MTDNWEDVANFLLRNRNIRKMVDEVLMTFDDVCQECNVSTADSQTYNKKKNKRRIKKLDAIQNQRLLKEYGLKKFVTHQRKTELARELNLSEVTIKNWFNNRRKRESLRNKRNKMRKKVQQTGNHSNDHYVYKHPQKITRHSSYTENADVPCDVSVNDDVKITAVTKLEIRPNCQKNLSGFVVSQDENGICVLYEL